MILNNSPLPIKWDGSASIRILNEPGFKTLGDCRNRLLKEADGELLRTWDDDDLYLPWAITQGVAHIARALSFKPARSWFHHGGHGFRLEGNTFEAAATYRTRFAKEVGYHPGAGDEHKNLLEAIIHHQGGRLRDMGIWASYCYTWGTGNWHISGSMGQGTDADRTADWEQRNNDHSSPRMAPIDLLPIWEEMKNFTGEDRDEWFAAAKNEQPAPVDVPKTEQYTELIRRCFPESGPPIAVLEFGRLRNTESDKLAADGGSTLQFCQSNRVHKILSVDPDDGSEEACRKIIPADLLHKVDFKRKLADCPQCSLSKYFDLVVIDANDDALQNLDLLRQSLLAQRPNAVIAVDDAQHQVKPLLIREVLRPTHREQRIGDLSVFTLRRVQRWQIWPIQMEAS